MISVFILIEIIYEIEKCILKKLLVIYDLKTVWYLLNKYALYLYLYLMKSYLWPSTKQWFLFL